MIFHLLAINIEQDFPPARKFGTIADILNAVIPMIILSSALLLLVMLFWGAFMIITGGDNPEQIKKARTLITHAILGLTIVAISFFLVKLIARIFNINLPL